MRFCVESFDTHNIFSFANNFHNNGPIFNQIGPLELSQSLVCNHVVNIERYGTKCTKNNGM